MANYEKKRGDTVTLQLTFTDANGDAIDITNYTVFFTLKNNRSDEDADAVITKDITNHSDPTNGITTITLSAAETADLLGCYWYDIQYKTGAGVIKTVVIGTYIFEEDVTIRTS